MKSDSGNETQETKPLSAEPKQIGPTKEQWSLLRGLAIMSGLGLFVTDYGMDAWAKPVPPMAYYIVGAIALGIDVPYLRDWLMRKMGPEDNQ